MNKKIINVLTLQQQGTSMKTSSAKAKGRKLQNWVRDQLQELWKNHIAPADIRGAIMGEGGEDIKLSDLAQQYINLSIECKNQEKLNVWAAYKQAQENCRPNDEPTVVIKRNNHKPLVVVDAKYFFNLHYDANKPTPYNIDKYTKD